MRKKLFSVIIFCCFVLGGAFPTTPILDSFTRANEGPPMSGWTDYYNGLQIISNVSSCQASADECDSYWTAIFKANQEVFFTVSTKPANNDFSCAVTRWSSSPNYTQYMNCFFPLSGTDEWNIQRCDNWDIGDCTIISGDNILQELTAGDSMGIRANGSTIEMWYKSSSGNWTLLDSAVDATYSNDGYILASLYNTTVRIDNFGGGKIGDAGRYFQMFSDNLKIRWDYEKSSYAFVLGVINLK